MPVDITGNGPNITATGTGSAITIEVTTGSGGGGGGAVDSVNGDTGVVVLDYADVGAKRAATQLVTTATTLTAPADVVAQANVTLPSAVTFAGQTITVTAAAAINVLRGGSDLFSFEGATSIPVAVRDSVTFVAFNGVPIGLPAGLWWPVSNVGSVRDALETAINAVQADPLVRTVPTRVFRCDGTDTGDWHTPHVGSFTGGYDFRAKIRPTMPDEPAGEWYSETGTQARDSGVGTIDNHEQAILRGHTPSNADLVTDKPYLFFECTPTGETTEAEPRLISDLRSAWDEWVTVRTTVNFATGVVSHWVEVWWEFSADETFDTTDDGKVWLRVGTLTDADYDSIDTTITEEWWLGHNFYGDIAWAEWYSGVDGTLLANPDASLVTPGATSFDDTAPGTNTWTAHSTASIVSLETATVDVVSNVAQDRILGRTASGSGNSEELTAAQVRSLIGVGYRVVSDTTVGAGGAASVSVDVTGLSLVRVIFAGNSERASAQDTLRMTFNSDTGSVYSTDSGALTTSLTIGTMPGALTNTDRAGWAEVELCLLSGYTKSGVGRATNIGSTATVGQSVVHRGLFSTITAAVTSVQLTMANADIAAGSRIVVLGV